MREEFRADLLEVGRLLVSMAEAVRTAMSAATTALLSADKEGAERVVRRDEEINALFKQVEEKVLRLLAQQAPVASDLRMVITSLHIGTDLERMGDLAEHVAKAALRRYPAVCVPSELAPTFGQMANIADRIAGKITLVLASRDIERAAELERDDDVMDELEKALFNTLLGPDWAHGVEAAVDAALLARFYERYADHAVNAGRHVIYLVTGES
ncbi:phosphate signaling complex protein PhoU [Catellatospora tritici]|uniref:phosphate signaling complex protein PhoU n=1 Tax=Catellatospora tritici TaxID=2851566 RepID=UPI001C2D7CE0|nr:phosphate signaling complex protein PhoU [Catellatospora tritici]MBV1849930.1 phosphate signaling complex protein PhoU [Catellatospora tritici]